MYKLNENGLEIEQDRRSQVKDTLARGNEYLRMLPEKERAEAVELLRKLVIAWDPDFTRLTEEEAKELEDIEKNGEYVDFEEAMKELKL